MDFFDFLGKGDYIVEKTLVDALRETGISRKSGGKDDSIMHMLFPDIGTDIIGKTGESLTQNALERSIDGYFKVLTNLLIPNGERKTEIDMVMIHEKGVFVIESKNYGGWIFGNEDQKNWVQTMPGGKKYEFYNPIKQNRTHCNALKNVTGLSDEKVYSIVVFSDRCELKAVPSGMNHITVVKRQHLIHSLQETFSKTEEVFLKPQIDVIYQKLTEYVSNGEELFEHKKQVQEMINKKK